MKKIIIFLQIVIALTLANCGGYESIYSSKTSNFNISSIEIDNNNKINLKIKNSLKRFSNPDSEKEIAVKISSEKNIITTSKDSKGNPKTFSMNIKLNLEINQNGTKRSNIFTETFGYSNKSNKFDLKQYEKNIQNNLTDKIIENLNLYLTTI